MYLCVRFNQEMLRLTCSAYCLWKCCHRVAPRSNWVKRCASASRSGTIRSACSRDDAVREWAYRRWLAARHGRRTWPADLPRPDHRPKLRSQLPPPTRPLRPWPCLLAPRSAPRPYRSSWLPRTPKYWPLMNQLTRFFVKISFKMRLYSLEFK